MSVEQEAIELIGYHGTNLDLLSEIDKNSLKISKGRGHWFGNGCYFFADGINTIAIEEIAGKWAIDQAWNKNRAAYDYTQYMILECKFKVSPDEFLNLNEAEGLKLFNEFRDMLLSKLFEVKKKVKSDDYKDSDVFDIMKQKLDLKVILGNVFLKYAELRRIGTGFKSRVPNVTIFCVEESENDYINPAQMKLIKKGAVI